MQRFTKKEKNIRFFHSLAKGRRKRLKIKRIQGSNGSRDEGNCE